MPRTRLLSTPLLLFIAACAVYAISTGFDFIPTWDDQFYVCINDTVKGFTTDHIRQAFTGYYVGNYAPFHILSYMMDHAFWGFNPAGYHLTNVLLHALNGVLFYHLLRRLEVTETGAAVAVWIFLFHPVQVETVAWISQRKNLLAMSFFLGALLAYHEYTRRESRVMPPYLLALLCMASAGLSKSVTVIFPAIALLFDATYGNVTNSSRRQKKFIDKIPFLLISVAVGLMAMLSQEEEIGGGRRDYPGGTPLNAVFTMVPVLVGYLKDCFFPFKLSPYYMVPIRQQPDGVFLFSLTFLAAIIFFGILLYRRMRPKLFWFGLFFIALLPVMQIVPLITLKNDRYLYFPILGFAVLAATTITLIHQQLALSSYRILLRSAVILLLLILPILSFQQTLYWRNDITIWSRAVEVDPENRLAWPLLAKGYTARGDSANALKAINRYMELRDKYGPPYGFKDL